MEIIIWNNKTIELKKDGDFIEIIVNDTNLLTLILFDDNYYYTS